MRFSASGRPATDAMRSSQARVRPGGRTPAGRYAQRKWTSARPGRCAREGFADVFSSVWWSRSPALHGRVEEEAADLDGRSDRVATGIHRRCRPRSRSPPCRAVRGAVADGHAADFGDGGEGLAAEAERGNAEEVVGGNDLAGGVRGDGEPQVVFVHAGIVVDNADQFQPARLDRDVYPGSAGVEPRSPSTLDDARRAFDDLAGGDFVDQALGKL